MHEKAQEDHCRETTHTQPAMGLALAHWLITLLTVGVLGWSLSLYVHPQAVPSHAETMPALTQERFIGFLDGVLFVTQRWLCTQSWPVFSAHKEEGTRLLLAYHLEAFKTQPQTCAELEALEAKFRQQRHAEK